jgi:hypothetical protein
MITGLLPVLMLIRPALARLDAAGRVTEGRGRLTLGPIDGDSFGKYQELQSARRPLHIASSPTELWSPHTRVTDRCELLCVKSSSRRLSRGGQTPVATCLAGSSCSRGRCPRPVLLARSPRRADEPATSGERRGLVTAGILGP